MGRSHSRFAALVILLAAVSSARAGGLTIIVGQHNYTIPQVIANPIQIIPIIVTGTDLVFASDISVQLGGTSTTVARFGTVPPITYEGSEQYNVPTPGAGSPVVSPSMWDAHPSSWTDDTDGASNPITGNDDDIPTIPGTPGYGTTRFREGTWFTGSVGFNSFAADQQINPNNGVLINLVVNLTGFENSFIQWPLRLLTGAAGSTDFVNLTSPYLVPLTIIDGSISIGLPVPEPSSFVLGLFGVAGLAIVANRKRWSRRSA